MPNTPFPVDPYLSAITVGYRNENYVAELVLPRTPVGRQEFKYIAYPIEESFRNPDSRVGRRGRVNEVLLTATETLAETADYGLEDPIPFPDIDQARSAGMRSPSDQAVQQLTDYIMIGREKRTADLVFDAAQYPASNKVQLTGTDQWDEFAEAASDPIEDIVVGMEAMLLRATHLLVGSAVWLKLRTHPKVVSAVLGNDGTRGVITRRELADLLELNDVLVGQARLNTAAYGQTAVLERIWGNHALLFHRNPSATVGGGVTFGYTAEYGTRVAGQMQDDKIGLRGGTRVRVGESVKELVVAPLAAFLFEDAI